MERFSTTSPREPILVLERELGDLQATVYSHPPLFSMPRHTHPNAYFSVILRGAYTETTRFKTREGRASTVIFHPAGETHAFRVHADELLCMTVTLGQGWAERVRPLSRPFDIGATFRGGRIYQLGTRLFRELNKEDAASSIAVEGLVLEIIADASRQIEPAGRRTTPRWLMQAREALDHEYMDPPKLDDMAKRVGVHAVHLSRAFRSHFGCTVGDYIRQLRVEHARKQMSDTSTPLVAIAADAGFSDQAHFTRIFKRMTGMTPGQYRARASQPPKTIA
jgi:AraC family transcriptional regulator